MPSPLTRQAADRNPELFVARCGAPTAWNGWLFRKCFAFVSRKRIILRLSNNVKGAQQKDVCWLHDHLFISEGGLYGGTQNKLQTLCDESPPIRFMFPELSRHAPWNPRTNMESQLTNQLAHRPTDKPTNQPINHSTNQPTTKRNAEKQENDKR